MANKVSLVLLIFEKHFVLFVPQPLVDAFEVQLNSTCQLFYLISVPLTLTLRLHEEALHFLDLLRCLGF